VLKVVGALPVVESGLVGNPAPKSEGWREHELTLRQTHLSKGFTRQQLERRITPPADGGRRRWDRYDENGSIARRQNPSKG